MKNLVQELIDHNPRTWFEILEHTYKIRVVKDGTLVSLKYNQIESPMHDPLVQQCRGMVVDMEEHRVVAWPYNKFWNHWEHLADTIDWTTARVQEKLDGSLMILYFHNGMWSVASSGHPTAGGSFGSDARTFREAFWATVASEKIYSELDTSMTYMLELCDAPNRVVVRHEQPRVVMHGARNLNTGKEFPFWELWDVSYRAGIELVKEFPINSVAACLDAASAINPLEQEGFVVVDQNFNRVKIKSPRYVLLHHMKGEATLRRAIELWQTGETSELLNSFPEMASVISPVQDKLDQVAERSYSDFLANNYRSRKEIALTIKHLTYSSIIFRLLDRVEPTLDDVKAIMRNFSLSALERMLQ